VSRPSLEKKTFGGPVKIVKEKDENVGLKAEIKRLRKIVEQQREFIRQTNVIIENLEADKKRLLAENDLEAAEKEQQLATREETSEYERSFDEESIQLSDVVKSPDGRRLLSADGLFDEQ
ncbi:Hypothetical predicted protein, partial [Paramuricea clavata]